MAEPTVGHRSVDFSCTFIRGFRAQAVVTAMLREYKESTRKARAAKWAELDAWWGEERRRRAVL